MAPGLEAGGKKGVLVKGKAGDKPMLDTGALYTILTGRLRGDDIAAAVWS